MQAVLVVGNDPEAVLTHVVADIEDQRSFVQVCMLKELLPTAVWSPTLMMLNTLQLSGCMCTADT